MARTYTDKQRAEALDLYVQHGPAEAARRTGIARNTISQWARRKGVTVTRDEKMRAAIEAAQVSLRHRQARLAGNLLDDAERLREQLWQEAKVHDFTKDGEFVTGKLAQPTFGDKRQILTSVAIAIDKVQLLTGGPTSRSEVVEASKLDREIEKLLGEMQELDGGKVPSVNGNGHRASA